MAEDKATENGKYFNLGTLWSVKEKIRIIL